MIAQLVYGRQSDGASLTSFPFDRPLRRLGRILDKIAGLGAGDTGAGVEVIG